MGSCPVPWIEIAVCAHLVCLLCMSSSDIAYAVPWQTKIISYLHVLFLLCPDLPVLSSVSVVIFAWLWRVCVKHLYCKNSLLCLLGSDCPLGNLYLVYTASLNVLTYRSGFVLSCKWLTGNCPYQMNLFFFFFFLPTICPKGPIWIRQSVFFFFFLCDLLLPKQKHLVLFSHLKIIMKDLEAARINLKRFVDVTSIWLL